MVLIASLSSVPPHIHPPIAQVPRPIREAFTGTPGILMVSMEILSASVPFSFEPASAWAQRASRALRSQFTEALDKWSAGAASPMQNNVCQTRGSVLTPDIEGAPVQPLRCQ